MKYRVVELFSGVGAQRMALKRIAAKHPDIEFEFLAQCDINKWAIQSYTAIHGETPNLGDITKVERLPDCDILTWSFPCQSLSISGKKEGMKKGTKTESSLGWEVVRLLKVSNRPEWLFMENVPALTFKTNLKDFNQIIKELGNLEYISKWGLFNSQDFGVPQDRTRCMMVSHLKKPVPDFPKPHPLTHMLGAFLESDINEKLYLSEDKLNKIIAISERAKAKGNGFRFDPRSINEICKTITTTPYHNGGLFVKSADSRIRYVTTKEAWRLMVLCPMNKDGPFNESNFKKAAEQVSQTQLYKQAGNSIVVDVLEAIFENILINGNTGQKSLMDY